MVKGRIVPVGAATDEITSMNITATTATISEIIEKWPSLAIFAADAGVTYEAAKQMRRRNSIPVQYWPGIVQAAVERDIGGVTPDDLMAAHVTKSTEAST